jgi:hypothetical protein
LAQCRLIADLCEFRGEEGKNSMSIRTFFEYVRRKLHPDHLSFIASGATIVLIGVGLEARSAEWVIYAIIGILMLLLLWRIATQWKVKTLEAENFRFTVVIVAFFAAALVVSLFMRQ